MNDQTSRPQTDDRSPLDTKLHSLAEHLVDAAPEAGWTLAALIPCDTVAGQVAVACWASHEDTEAAWEWALLSMDTGAVIEDRAAIRDAFTLVAMHESLAESLDSTTLRNHERAIRAWIESSERHSAELAQALEHVARAASELAATAPIPGAPMLARADRLDQWGGLVRELERRMDAVDIHAERWSNTHASEDPDAVRALWMLLAEIRGSTLSQPVSMRLQAGREAGVALAEQVLGTTPSPGPASTSMHHSS